MKKNLLCLLIFFNVFAGAQEKKAELEGDDVFVDGKKIGSIIDTKPAYNTVYTEYVLRDVNGVDRMKVNGFSGNLHFLDDSSFVARYKKEGFASAKKLIARCMANAKLFDEKGYNEVYKGEFIKKNIGVLYDKTTRQVLSVAMRDTSKPVDVHPDYDGNWKYISQDGYLVGYAQRIKKSSNYHVNAIFNLYGVKIATVYSQHTSNGIVSNEIIFTKGLPGNFEKITITDYSMTGEPTFDAPARAFKKRMLFDVKPNDINDSSSNTTNPSSKTNTSTTLPSPNKQNSTPVNNTAPATNNTPPNATVLSPSGFSTYSTKSSEKLEAMKKDAVSKNDFDAAAAIKTELDLRKAEQEKVANFQKDLDEKVKAEDYAGASKIQKEIGPLKEKIQKKEQIRKDMDEAVAAQNYEKAEQLKQELKTLY